MALKELDLETALKLQAALKKYGGSFTLMRKAVKLLDIRRDVTVIPRKFFKLCFAVRKAMLDPTDLGAHGRYHEAWIRIMENPHVTRVKWGEFFAHAEERHDIDSRSGSLPMEVKTGAGDWLKSATFTELDDILNEYRYRAELIRWDVDTTYRASNHREDSRNGTSIKFSIQCTWGELIDYLATYNGGGFWKKPKESKQGFMVVGMQEFNTSFPKCEWLLDCPYRIDK